MTPRKNPDDLKKVGRKSKYQDKETIRQAVALCELGATDAQLAKFFRVSKETINKWKRIHPEFIASLKKAKEKCDSLVEKSLFQRARGYKHKAVHISNYKGQITETPYIEHYPPDAVSCIFWLKNRQPEKWREKQEVEHSGNISVVVNINKKNA